MIHLPPRLRSLLLRFLPRRFAKHYLGPFLERRPRRAYDARQFFDSWYRAAGGVSDGTSVAQGGCPLFERFHYNDTENAMIRCLVGLGLPERPAVLDVGCGAGHWIDFYLELFGASRVVGADVANECVTALQSRYEARDDVEIVPADVSADGFALDERFDIINAIGVLFHIVEDSGWRRALANLSRHLSDRGVIVIGCNYGLITRDVQFHDTDRFDTWAEACSSGKTALVNKRIRSAWRWRRAARDVGLRVVSLARTRTCRGLPTPENNVLCLAHRAADR